MIPLWVTVLLAVLLCVAVMAFVSLSRFLRRESVAGPGRVSAPPDAAPRRLAEVIDDLSQLEARFKGIQREWADFSKSWERRWGTVTRSMHRDGIAAAAGEDAPGAGEDDPAQLRLEPVANESGAAGERRHLRPARVHFRNGPA